MQTPSHTELTSGSPQNKHLKMLLQLDKDKAQEALNLAAVSEREVEEITLKIIARDSSLSNP